MNLLFLVANEDSETEDAKEMAKEIDLLDISGVVDFKPVSDSDSDSGYQQ